MNNKIEKERLDIFLVKNNFFETREKAKIAIMEGNIYVNNLKEDKPGTIIKVDSNVEFRGNKMKYVSRGGYKLEKAIETFNIDCIKDNICIDIGSSTGGFTDCMLQYGAKKVYAIDCGTNQLDYKLRCDSRVQVFENVNARYVTSDIFEDDNISFVTMDVSFISIKKIIPTLINVLNKNVNYMCLIKPQFEADKNDIGKKGLIKDKEIHLKICNDILDFLLKLNLSILNFTYSPIKGQTGNIEYLIYFTDAKVLNVINENDIKSVVDESHNLL